MAAIILAVPRLALTPTRFARATSLALGREEGRKGGRGGRRERGMEKLKICVCRIMSKNLFLVH